MNTSALLQCSEQLIADDKVIGWLLLDSPKTLNSLTLDMVEAMQAQWNNWMSRQDVVCVVLAGEGRAFCAGGDVRRMREGILAGNDYCDRFFAAEYRIDHAIHAAAKPVLCWGHGVVMGGGIGLLMGASHRVVTPSTRMAMPEVNIGLYPDVGASYFLSRLPAGLGLFLGISGCEWNGQDALAFGFADHLLEDTDRARLAGCLATCAWSGDPAADRQQLSLLLAHLPHASLPGRVSEYAARLADAADAPLLEALSRLSQLAIDEPWFRQALDNLQHGCPVTLRLVEEQLRRGRSLSLAEAFRQEWIMSAQCARHPDFPEGVRAQLVDKDRLPRWSWPDPALVPAAVVEEHFINPVAVNPLRDLA